MTKPDRRKDPDTVDRVETRKPLVVRDRGGRPRLLRSASPASCGIGGRVRWPRDVRTRSDCRPFTPAAARCGFAAMTPPGGAGVAGACEVAVAQIRYGLALFGKGKARFSPIGQDPVLCTKGGYVAEGATDERDGPPTRQREALPHGNVVVCVESELLTEALQQSDCLGSPAPAQPVPGEWRTWPRPRCPTPRRSSDHVGQQVLQHPGGEGGGAPAALAGDRDPSHVREFRTGCRALPPCQATAARRPSAATAFR
jgi:hypothetical protein